uniref:hypothetical protein n=1 Tax=Acinetobacter bereziniae TaxID=106648 RepID=UPI00148F2D94
KEVEENLKNDGVLLDELNSKITSLDLALKKGVIPSSKEFLQKAEIYKKIENVRNEINLNTKKLKGLNIQKNEYERLLDKSKNRLNRLKDDLNHAKYSYRQNIIDAVEKNPQIVEDLGITIEADK